jgi:hypothetical protein
MGMKAVFTVRFRAYAWHMGIDPRALRRRQYRALPRYKRVKVVPPRVWRA